MFAFRLAAHLGMTVRRLLAEIGSDELAEWVAFERLEPFGSLVDDYRAGTIAAQARNAARQRKEDHYFDPEDFAVSVKQAKSRTKAARVVEMTDDQYADLMDAEIFGHVRH